MGPGVSFLFMWPRLWLSLRAIFALLFERRRPISCPRGIPIFLFKLSSFSAFTPSSLTKDPQWLIYGFSPLTLSSDFSTNFFLLSFSFGHLLKLAWGLLSNRTSTSYYRWDWHRSHQPMGSNSKKQSKIVAHWPLEWRLIVAPRNKCSCFWIWTRVLRFGLLLVLAGLT